jgi:hypothetical protein
MVSETTKELREQAQELMRMAREGEKREKLSEDAKDAAMGISALKDALVVEGFTQEQAFELVKLIIGMGGKK